MAVAQNAARRILDTLETVEKLFQVQGKEIPEADPPEETKEKWIRFRRRFEDAMDDDFNTAKALGVSRSTLMRKIKEYGLNVST